MNKDYGAFVTQDSTKCTGCRACELACFAAHESLPGRTVGGVTTPVVPRLFVTWTPEGCAPVQCRHCEDAPCVAACGRGAILRAGGQVVIDTTLCNDCRDHSCVDSCVFGAIRRLPFAAKCDLCPGREPACVAACPNGALRFVDAAAEREANAARALQYLRHIG